MRATLSANGSPAAYAGFVVYATEVVAESADEAWRIADAPVFEGDWQRLDVLEFDHTERGDLDEIEEAAA